MNLKHLAQRAPEVPSKKPIYNGANSVKSKEQEAVKALAFLFPLANIIKTDGKKIG